MNEIEQLLAGLPVKVTMTEFGVSTGYAISTPYAYLLVTKFGGRYQMINIDYQTYVWYDFKDRLLNTVKAVFNV